jgi:predicted short-subunit dehydrogenase-like oxidoreductase (DUF2520 family)
LDFLLADLQRLFGHDEVDQVVHVGKLPAAAKPNARAAVEALRGNVSPGLGDGLLAIVQALDKKSARAAQLGRESPVAASKVYDETALDPRRIEDALGLVPGRPLFGQALSGASGKKQHREHPDFRPLGKGFHK